MIDRNQKGSPRWYDPDNNKECDHDAGSTTVRKFIGYSDFGYFRSRCDHPECDETWDWWIEG